MTDDRPPIEVLAARVETVRRLYGLGQVLPPEVSVFQPIPEGLPVVHRLCGERHPGSFLGERCRVCGSRERVPNGPSSRCGPCQRRAARVRWRRRNAAGVGT